MNNKNLKRELIEVLEALLRLENLIKNQQPPSEINQSRMDRIMNKAWVSLSKLEIEKKAFNLHDLCCLLPAGTPIRVFHLGKGLDLHGAMHSRIKDMDISMITPFMFTKNEAGVIVNIAPETYILGNGVYFKEVDENV